MARLLLLVALAALVWWLWRRLARLRDKPAAPPPPGAELMVRCAHCGLHLPRKEALAHAERWYCCEEHRLADDASRPD